MSIFICRSCGHIEFGSAPDSCPVCGAPKRSFQQNDKVFEESAEKSKEGAVKHIPSVKVNRECGLIPENDCTDLLIRVGETLHPMTPEHFIHFIDCYIDRKYAGRAYLTPSMNPSVIFHLKDKGSQVQIVENCSLHGYWMTETPL
jgi:superoxide reductase